MKAAINFFIRLLIANFNNFLYEINIPKKFCHYHPNFIFSVKPKKMIFLAAIFHTKKMDDDLYYQFKHQIV